LFSFQDGAAGSGSVDGEGVGSAIIHAKRLALD
jgi:hypothetical protein